MSALDPLDLIAPKTLAELLHVPPELLQRWRSRGVGPCFVRLSPSTVRYRRQDVEEWLRERRVGDETERSVTA
jgi:hypothetical protein